MKKVINLSEYMFKWITARLKCTHCGNEMIHSAPVDTILNPIQCGTCDYKFEIYYEKKLNKVKIYERDLNHG